MSTILLQTLTLYLHRMRCDAIKDNRCIKIHCNRFFCPHLMRLDNPTSRHVRCRYGVISSSLHDVCHTGTTLTRIKSSPALHVSSFQPFHSDICHYSKKHTNEGYNDFTKQAHCSSFLLGEFIFIWSGLWVL